jgi:hypothetical protein
MLIGLMGWMWCSPEKRRFLPLKVNICIIMMNIIQGSDNPSPAKSVDFSEEILTAK